MSTKYGADRALASRGEPHIYCDVLSDEMRIPQVYNQNQHLHGTPVLIVENHDMLPILAGWFRTCQNSSKKAASAPAIVYIMSDEGELPLAVNKPSCLLREMEWFRGVVTYGHAYGGDVEAADRYTALAVAKNLYKADLILISKGADHKGTGRSNGGWATRGISLSAWSSAVEKLGGRAIPVPAIGTLDPDNPWESQKSYARMSCHFLEELAKPEAGYCSIALPEPGEKPVHQLLKCQLVTMGISHAHDIHWIEGMTTYRMAQIMAAIPDGVGVSSQAFMEHSSYCQGICVAAELAWRLLPGKEIPDFM